MPNPLVRTLVSSSKLGRLRKQARHLLKPVSGSMHRAQTAVRIIPAPARKGLDILSGLVPLPTLLVESTSSDLLERMDEAGIERAVVIAHPPLISNEMVLALAEDEPRIIPVVNISKGTEKPGAQLKAYVQRGARALKIHPAADGEGVGSPRYRALLKVASEENIPVIVHTGCIHSHVLFKDPEQGHAERFSPWFRNFPEVQFILAHMNFHDPAIALDLVEEYPNVHVDTSWQPTEVIAEAVRRVGASRVLFATDWPFVGDNLRVSLKRIRECVDSGLLNASDSELILGKNAAKLLKL